MRVCQPHWERLKTAIADRGMDGLVARSGAELVGRLTTELATGVGSRDTFDPLMAAHNLILQNAIRLAGIGIMVQNDDGTDRCPLCWLNEAHKHQCAEDDCAFSYDNWCEKAADDVLAAWRAGPPVPPSSESDCGGVTRPERRHDE